MISVPHFFYSEGVSVAWSSMLVRRVATDCVISHRSVDFDCAV